MKLLRQLFSRVVLVSLGIAIQLAWLFFLVIFCLEWKDPTKRGIMPCVIRIHDAPRFALCGSTCPP